METSTERVEAAGWLTAMANRRAVPAPVDKRRRAAAMGSGSKTRDACQWY